MRCKECGSKIWIWKVTEAKRESKSKASELN